RWGLTGWNRLFNAQFGGQISWLIPAAIVLLAVMLLLTFRRPRTDIVRAAFLTWGGVLLLTGAVFSFAQGIIHPYYTVALAPAIAAALAGPAAYAADTVSTPHGGAIPSAGPAVAAGSGAGAGFGGGPGAGGIGGGGPGGFRGGLGGPAPNGPGLGVGGRGAGGGFLGASQP